MPSDTALRKLYIGDYEFRVDSTSLLRFKVSSQGIVSALKRLLPSGKTLLDIGTGYGTFVEVALAKGLDPTGIEPAKNLYEAARKKLKSRIIHTDLNRFIKVSSDRYDFVSAIHVVEHLKEPGKFLAKAMKLLKPGGVLYMETPNSDSNLTNVEKGDYTFLTPPDHTHLFSKQSLELLINDVTKTSVSHFSTYSYPEHLVGILRTVRRGGVRYHPSPDRESGFAIPMNLKKDRERHLPFFDRVVAPMLTPLLNIGNRGSFLQVFVQKQN